MTLASARRLLASGQQLSQRGARGFRSRTHDDVYAVRCCDRYAAHAEPANGGTVDRIGIRHTDPQARGRRIDAAHVLAAAERGKQSLQDLLHWRRCCRRQCHLCPRPCGRNRRHPGPGALNLPAEPAHPVIEPMLIAQSFYRMANALSLARGLDPDRPPNLRKVTETV